MVDPEIRYESQVSILQNAQQDQWASSTPSRRLFAGLGERASDVVARASSLGPWERLRQWIHPHEEIEAREIVVSRVQCRTMLDGQCC